MKMTIRTEKEVFKPVEIVFVCESRSDLAKFKQEFGKTSGTWFMDEFNQIKRMLGEE